MKQIILASASPRRRELLAQIGLDFTVLPASGEEKLTKQIPSEIVEELSSQKAEAVAEQIPDAIIIGADTVVCQDGEIMGKPKDEADALRMLRQLQGEMHSVFTGVTLIVKENGSVISKQTFSQETRVYLYAMTDEEIQDYIATGEPMDKAGAYGVQSRGALFVERIDGDFFNVMGLPVEQLGLVLARFGVKLL